MMWTYLNNLEVEWITTSKFDHIMLIMLKSAQKTLSTTQDQPRNEENKTQEPQGDNAPLKTSLLTQIFVNQESNDEVEIRNIQIFERGEKEEVQSVYLDEEEKPSSPKKQLKAFSETYTKNSLLYNQIKSEMESSLTRRRVRNQSQNTKNCQIPCLIY